MALTFFLCLCKLEQEFIPTYVVVGNVIVQVGNSKVRHAPPQKKLKPTMYMYMAIFNAALGIRIKPHFFNAQQILIKHI